METEDNVLVDKSVPWLDRAISRAISRKLTVFILGTIFMLAAFLTAEQWMTLAVAYIGTQGFIDAIAAYRKVT